MPDNPYQLSFWDDDESEMWDDLAPLILDIYLSGIDGGVAALPKNIQVLTDWDYVNTKALEFAKQYRYTLIKGITDTTRTQTQKAISDWIQSGAPLDALESTLERIYGPVRAQMIAQTETTRVFQTANSDAWLSTGLVSQMRYNTVVDDAVCPICSPNDGQIYDLNDTEHTPPLHVNCRCFTTPVLDEEVLSRKLDETAAIYG